MSWISFVIITPMTLLKDPNPGKDLSVTIDGTTYNRYPIKTPVIHSGDNLIQILKEDISKDVQEGDILLLAESVVAISQGRGYLFSDITYGKTAEFISRFVTRTPAGIGLGTPQTMQLAINEAGYLRIIFAFLVAAVTKPLGWKGNFYRIAGSKARAIDGPTAGTLPPYNEFATLSPKNPRSYAEKTERAFDSEIEVIIVDANDIGVNILGARDSQQERLGEALCADNPMGQGSEGTPALLCRAQ